MAAIRKVRKHGRVRWRISWYDARLTRSTYGRWFKLRDLAAADHQDARSSLVVTKPVTDAEHAG